MPKNNTGSSVTDTRLYAALRKEGIKKKKAKRVVATVNPASRAPATKRRKSKSPKSSQSYETWTKTDLLRRARVVGIKGRSKMTKSQLTRALRGA